MYHNFFIHSSVDEHLCCFHIVLKLLYYIAAIVNSAAVNTGIRVSLSAVFSEYIPRSGVVGRYGSFISSF